MCIPTSYHFLPPKKINSRYISSVGLRYSKRKGEGAIATRQRFKPHEKVGGVRGGR